MISVLSERRDIAVYHIWIVTANYVIITTELCYMTTNFQNQFSKLKLVQMGNRKDLATTTRSQKSLYFYREFCVACYYLVLLSAIK